MVMVRITAWNPALDLGENDKEITIRVEVPGITPDAIDIQIHGDQLVISGEKKSVTKKMKPVIIIAKRVTASSVAQ